MSKPIRTAVLAAAATAGLFASALPAAAAAAFDTPRQAIVATGVDTAWQSRRYDDYDGGYAYRDATGAAFMRSRSIATPALGAAATVAIIAGARRHHRAARRRRRRRADRQRLTAGTIACSARC